jgi:hypothetical protein
MDNKMLIDEEKHNAICVAHHYSQINTDNVNKTWVPPQTTWGKDEPNFSSGNINGHHNTIPQSVKKHNRTHTKT